MMLTKKLCATITLMALSTLPALADEAPEQEATINKAAYMTALVHSERKPRSWKTLWLKPGAVVTYEYEWIMPDGTKKAQTSPDLMPGVPDRRPPMEAHPNWCLGGLGVQLSAQVLSIFF